MNLKKVLLFLLPITFLAISIVVYLKNNDRLSQNYSCSPSNFTGLIDPSDTIAYFEGKKLDVPKIALEDNSVYVLGVKSESDKWIEVDLSDQKLYAWEGDKLFLESDISSGLPWWPTPKGEFNIWIKLRATKMEGGEGKYYYNLPNVPFTMFFEGDGASKYLGYGLHGAYWHNDFGNPHSHGCVNLPIPIAQELYYWSDPQIPSGKYVVYSDESNPGTRIIIHD